MGQNYFNSLSFSRKLQELGNCRFMESSEFNGVDYLKGKKVVIVGCGAQGLNQGLNMRDSGLDISYALRKIEIDEKHISWENATQNNFEFDTIENMVPKGDLVLNLTPDKYHTPIVNHVMPLMKKGACLSYSHGFNIVEEGMKIREDLTVIMVAPKSPGSEVRAEYLRGFGVPTLIAVHTENDPNGDGLDIAKAYCCGTGGDRAGVLFSSFTAEVKSDLMGEQTVGVEITGGAHTLFYIPGCAAMTPALAERLQGAGTVLFDGTVFHDDEMIREGVGVKTGQRMGHMAMAGEAGSMAAFSRLGVARKVYVHINNTNPVWRPDSAERAEVEAAGWEIGYDGMDIAP